MIKIPFYKRLIFKVFMSVVIVLSVSFFISYIVTTKYTNKIINKHISKEFNNAINVTENFIKFVGQTAQIWAKHIIIDNDIQNKILNKDFTELRKFLKIEKEAISADSVILLDKDATILSQVGSNFTKGDSLSLQDIVKETFKTKLPVTKVARERESFIIYSSSLIYQDDEVLGMVLVGYFINDIFLQNIKINQNIEIAFIGKSAILSSTKWGGDQELNILPMEYIKYQTLLKTPTDFQKINYFGNAYMVSARKMNYLDSSIIGSILVGHNIKDINFSRDEMFYKTLMLFSFVFIFTLIVLLYLSRKVVVSIETLKNSTKYIAKGDYSHKLNIKTDDEFALLANNFNDMATAIKLKDKQLANYTYDLEKEVEKRTQELIQKEKELSQKSKMALMGEMLENIAHQWRQPLSVISTSATGLIMQKEFKIATDDDDLAVLGTINNSAQHLSQTINDFRDFFKSDKTKELFNVKDIYLKTLSIVSASFKNKEIEIINNLEDIEVYGYSGELMQVIINLLNNARDILIAKEDKKLLFINIYQENQTAIIKIKDNGGGIPNDIIDKIFEPYFTTKHKAQGTGIGLYMCQQMIVKHVNGTISANNIKYRYEDKDNTGAEFTISIPINKEIV